MPLKLRVCYSSSLVRGNWSAWVCYPFMFFSDAKEEVSDVLFRHEMQHVYQVQRMGWFKFYLTYLWLLRKHDHSTHPYENEAREHENEPLTTVELFFKDH